MLSPEELFKFQQDKSEKTIPQKGGSKGYMPQSTWLENKCLESFHTERENVLSEPRVFRPCDIVQGELNTDKGLVEIHQDMKNFWKHSGFTYKKRKWLHPEEALYLMETNVLELWYKGLPLSIQQAYGLLIGMGMSLEFYQVYAHLKRMEYVVIRHQGRSKVTRYEKKIGLDKYLHGTRKERKKAAWLRKDDGPSQDAMSFPTSSKQLSMWLRKDDGDSQDSTSSPTSRKQVSVGNSGVSIGDEISGPDGVDMMEVSNETEVNADVVLVDEVGDDKVDSSVNSNLLGGTDELALYEEEKRTEPTANTELESRLVANEIEMEPENPSSDNPSLLSITDIKSSEKSDVSPVPQALQRYSGRNFDDIVFPDFGTSCTISKPDKNLLPQKTDLCRDVYTFDKETVLNRKKCKWRDRDFESDARQDFSYSVLMSDCAEANRECKNWAEYKAFMKQKKEEYSRPYREEDEAGVAPLVKPEDAFSTRAILDKLHIIEEAEDFPPLSQVKPSQVKPDVLPDFDLYKGDSNFAKTCPGIPDHRVCVARCGAPVPGLAVTNSMTSYLGDGVPVYWAVVDHGSIAFYEMSDFTLPVDISLG